MFANTAGGGGGEEEILPRGCRAGPAPWLSPGWGAELPRSSRAPLAPSNIFTAPTEMLPLSVPSPGGAGRRGAGCQEGVIRSSSSTMPPDSPGHATPLGQQETGREGLGHQNPTPRGRAQPQPRAAAALGRSGLLLDAHHAWYIYTALGGTTSVLHTEKPPCAHVHAFGISPRGCAAS